MLGSMPIRIKDPAREMDAERRKPGFERSMRYHKKGFTRARVRES